jgi:NAD/NADP transhydrogenase alpha subunit
MRSESNGCGLESEEIAERAIVLQVLRDDRDERWSRAELEHEIYDIEPLMINEALERLSEEGVVCLAGEFVWASRCARRLDALGMVSI